MFPETQHFSAGVVHGGCLITKSEGAIVYKSSDLKHLPKGTRWLVYGRKGKYLIVGNEKTGKYINGAKVEISL